MADEHDSPVALLSKGYAMDFTSKNGSKLPQSGWLLDSEWADILEIEARNFRQNCRKYGIPFKTFGNMMLVKAEDFYQFAPGNAEEE